MTSVRDFHDVGGRSPMLESDREVWTLRSIHLGMPLVDGLSSNLQVLL